MSKESFLNNNWPNSMDSDELVNEIYNAATDLNQNLEDTLFNGTLRFSESGNNENSENHGTGINALRAKIIKSYKIAEQPKSTFRFRGYNGEETHGVILSECGNSFPKVQLEVCDEYINEEFFVSVDIYTNSTVEHNMMSTPILSPHIFGLKQTLEGKEIYEKIHEPLWHIMEKQPDSRIFEYSLENYGIISRARGAIQHVKSKYNDHYNGYLNDETIEANENVITKSNNSVCLGFTVYRKTPQREFQYCEGPLLTNPIKNADQKIKLDYVCNKRVRAGEDMSLVVTGIANMKVKVIIKAIDRNWEKAIEEYKMRKNVVLTFQIPEYKGGLSGDFNCKVYLEREDGVRSNDNTKSGECTFVYEVPVEPQATATGKRRKFEQILEQPDLASTSNRRWFYDGVFDPIVKKPNDERKTVDEEPEKLEKLTKMMPKLRITRERAAVDELKTEFTDDAILYEAMEDDSAFLKLSKKKKSLANISRTNIFHDNLLHHACRVGKYRLIRYLVGMFCEIWQVNYKKQTPLHLAIEIGEKNTLHEWADLIEHPTEYSHFVEEFKRALAVYDRQGLTVLHYAVIMDQRELVKAIMKFYKNSNIELSEFEVLGNGDSVLHLAAEKRLVEMGKLIIEMEPEAKNYTNYAGDEISEDFLKLL